MDKFDNLSIPPNLTGPLFFVTQSILKIGSFWMDLFFLCRENPEKKHSSDPIGYVISKVDTLFGF